MMPLQLNPQGVLIMETFGQGNEQFGKPSNPLFLLAPEACRHSTRLYRQRGEESVQIH